MALIPNSFIKSIQSGVISSTPGGNPSTVTITAVNTSKAILLNLGYYSSTSNTKVPVAEIVLTNSTTITMNCASVAGTDNVTCSYMVVEFY